LASCSGRRSRELSLLKRGVIGTYHKVSADYLPLYLNEFSYRHSRKNPFIFEPF
jgi:hypothetical protein